MRLVTGVFLVVTCLFVTLCVACLASHVYFDWVARAASARARQLSKRKLFGIGEVDADLAHLSQFFERVHPAETADFPFGSIEAQLHALQESTREPLSALGLYRELAPIVNGTGDEHTSMAMPRGPLEAHYAAGGRLFPCRVRSIRRRLFLSSTTACGSLPAGTEIRSINGEPIEKLQQRLIGFFAGTNEIQRLHFMARSFRDALFLLDGPMETFELFVREPGRDLDCRVNLAGVVAESTADNGDFTALNTSPMETPPDSDYRLIPQDETIIFNFARFDDAAGVLSRLFAEVFKVARSRDFRSLVIDLRDNDGGDSFVGDTLLRYLTDQPFSQFASSDVTTSREIKNHFLSFVPGFIRWLPIGYLHPITRGVFWAKDGEVSTVSFPLVGPKRNPLRFKGDVYLLIGPGVYSSSSFLAATVREYGLGTLIGSQSGGFPTHYGNVMGHYLPKTGLRVNVPGSLNHGNGIGAISPDHFVEQSVQDLTVGRDTVLEFTLDLIRSRADGCVERLASQSS